MEDDNQAPVTRKRKRGAANSEFPSKSEAPDMMHATRSAKGAVLSTMTATAFNRLSKSQRAAKIPRLAKHKSMPSIKKDFEAAQEFAKRTHQADIDWVNSRQSLVRSFDEFYDEYAYVIVASGFRARLAATLAPKLVDAARSSDGDYESMLKLFGNKSKVKALSDVWKLRSDWPRIRTSIKTTDDLLQFPRVGPIVKFHLSRNIGLESCVKPDIHLTAFAASHGWTDVQQMVSDVSSSFNLTPGVADFILFIWLMHNRGVCAACCFGGHPIR
eukprot:gnl/Hemi2/21324_TR7084_c0_g1_i1.p1 gnl/Hemi2/21324_TR7084_c0_g1~~gnl/Hemi2/21324_TR7084_c0_g1_i1.p1  ORF type:complete len:272 (-),score=29.55 gnl/Hemi2/21324_TR7084_c0_g1_i1:26-841(-)